MGVGFRVGLALLLFSFTPPCLALSCLVVSAAKVPEPALTHVTAHTHGWMPECLSETTPKGSKNEHQRIMSVWHSFFDVFYPLLEHATHVFVFGRTHTGR